MRAGILGARRVADPRNAAINAASMAALDGRWDDVRAALADAPETAIAELNDMLTAHGRACGDWGPLAALAWHVPSPWRIAAGDELAKRITPPATAAPRPDSARRRLARFALACLRQSCTPRELLAKLDAENARLPKPLDRRQVGEVAVWAVRAIGEQRRAA